MTMTAADRGVIGEHQVGPLLRAYLVASMDTTINSIGSALWLFAEHPGAWAALRADRTSPRSAFEEVVRFESPVQMFFRRTTEAVEIDGVTIPPQARVAMLFGAANRDPRKWPEPDRFDVGRAPMDHVGFGYGVHGTPAVRPPVDHARRRRPQAHKRLLTNLCHLGIV